MECGRGMDTSHRIQTTLRFQRTCSALLRLWIIASSQQFANSDGLQEDREILNAAEPQPKGPPQRTQRTQRGIEPQRHRGTKERSLNANGSQVSSFKFQVSKPIMAA